MKYPLITLLKQNCYHKWKNEYREEFYIYFEGNDNGKLNKYSHPDKWMP